MLEQPFEPGGRFGRFGWHGRSHTELDRGIVAQRPMRVGKTLGSRRCGLSMPCAHAIFAPEFTRQVLNQRRKTRNRYCTRGARCVGGRLFGGDHHRRGLRGCRTTSWCPALAIVTAIVVAALHARRFFARAVGRRGCFSRRIPDQLVRIGHGLRGGCNRLDEDEGGDDRRQFHAVTLFLLNRRGS